MRFDDFKPLNAAQDPAARLAKMTAIIRIMHRGFEGSDLSANEVLTVMMSLLMTIVRKINRWPGGHAFLTRTFAEWARTFRELADTGAPDVLEHQIVNRSARDVAQWQAPRIVTPPN